MIFHQLKLLFRLKLTIWQRTIWQIPIVYLALLLVFALFIGWALIKADIAVTWKSIAVVAALQFLVCKQLKYPNNKKELLNQYKALFTISFLIDSLITTFPYLFLHFYFWLVALGIVIIYTLYISFSDKSDNELEIKQLVIPSPFFPKSAYLWHSQYRVFLPAVWLFIATITVIAHIHENFNLAIVTYGIGIFTSLITTILQKEKSDFISIYLNNKHFRKQTIKETLASVTVLSLPLSVLLLSLFPSEWLIISISFLCVLLVSMNLLWIKYIFYPSIMPASLFLFIGIFIQAVFTLSLYSTPLILTYYIALYSIFKKRTDKYFTGNERVDY